MICKNRKLKKRFKQTTVRLIKQHYSYVNKRTKATPLGVACAYYILFRPKLNRANFLSQLRF